MDREVVPDEPLPVEDELALYANALVELVGREVPPWTPRVRREIDLVRGHLAPIRSRPLLASSFGRESLHRREPLSLGIAAARLAASPVLVAYAIRWLELAANWQSPHAVARRRARRQPVASR